MNNFSFPSNHRALLCRWKYFQTLDEHESNMYRSMWISSMPFALCIYTNVSTWIANGKMRNGKLEWRRHYMCNSNVFLSGILFVHTLKKCLSSKQKQNKYLMILFRCSLSTVAFPSERATISQWMGEKNINSRILLLHYIRFMARFWEKNKYRMTKQKQRKHCIETHPNSKYDIFYPKWRIKNIETHTFSIEEQIITTR